MDNNTEKDTDVILEVKDLKTYFKTGPHKVVKAVEGVNFSLRKGKVLGIIGESGSGKSVTARSILRIVESPGYIAGGEIRFKGQDILKLPEKEMKSIRGNEISMIFQDPTTSFNPYMTIGAQLAEAYNAHTPSGSEKAKQEIMRVLKLVGITNGEEVIKKYPCEFSAGFGPGVIHSDVNDIVPGSAHSGRAYNKSWNHHSGGGDSSKPSVRCRSRPASPS